MKNSQNNSNMLRQLVRACVFVTLFVGPLAGLAAAEDTSRKLNGAGFVLYVATIR